MSVEILSVSLSEESVEALAQRLAQLLGQGTWPATQSNPPASQNPQPAASPESQPQGDPWLNQGGQQNQQQGGYQQGPPAQQYQQQGPPQGGQQFQGQQQGYQQGPGQGQMQQGQNCAHGPMQFVPAGVNRNTNEPYNAYYKCPLQRGAQGRCRNVYPNGR